MKWKVVFFLIIVVNFKCPRCYEMPDREMWEISEFHTYIKFAQDSDLFASTKVKADVQEYNAGLLNEDVYLNVSQLIQKYSHVVEEHEVKTEDGYILTLVRIPREGPVVLLMHGLLGSADDWVTAGPESGIAYLLANDGYDVWMGNARGNKHSRRHKSLEPSTFAFWDFSWDEIGRYDLPAMVDYVLHAKNQTKLIYIGHSQGTTAFLVMCSEIPEYNDKISLMVALSAPAAIPNMRSPFLNFLKAVTLHHPELLFSLAKQMGFYEFLPSNELINNFGPKICGTAELAQIICSNIAFMFCGFDAAQLNVTNLPVIFSHTPSGASTKQIEHYSQTVISGEFRRFDHGETRNVEIYGSKIPPEYQVEKISAPIVIFYSDNDWLVSLEDVEVLRNRLKNVVEFYQVPHADFNHMDYLFAKDLKQLVFSKLVSIMKQY